MKAALIRKYSGAVAVEEITQPVPGPGDLLVRVRAASVNPVDFKIRDGKVKQLIRYKMPLVLGNDLAGDVEAVGPGVTKFAVGDAIYTRLDKDRIGAFAEYVLVRESAAANKPANLGYDEAASLPLVALTAWQALIDIAKLKAGQRVLIHAGSGGVGTFAIQLARHLGAEVVTTASPRNHELVRSLGATTIIDYKTERFEDKAGECDVVFDTQGGETLQRSFSVIRRGGVVVTVGGVPDAKFARAWGVSAPVVWALAFMMRKVTRLAKEHDARFEYLFMRADGSELASVAELVEKGEIRPVLDKRYSLAEITDALAYVESGRAVGKVVIQITA
jgi:alcohol dehydrogenase